MNVLIILNFLTAIVALVVLCKKRHFVFALVALFCSILYGYGIWHAGLNVDDKLCQILHDEEMYGRDKAYPAALGGWVALILSKLLIFVLYCLRLSLSLNKSKIGCVSTIKTKIVDFCFVLSSTFTIFEQV